MILPKIADQSLAIERLTEESEVSLYPSSELRIYAYTEGGAHDQTDDDAQFGILDTHHTLILSQKKKKKKKKKELIPSTCLDTS
jgi:hypothetical protein